MLKEKNSVEEINETVKKNEEYIVDIIDYGADGEGIAKINGYTVFVIGAIKGEKCKIHITKVQKDYGFARTIQVLTKSNYRITPDCSTYPRCGGCMLRHIAYDETLKIKQNKIQNLANKMINVKNNLKENVNIDNKVNVQKTIGMQSPLYYRNKAIYPINKNKEVGIFASRSHEIIPIKECKIQTLNSQKIAKYIAQNWNDSIYDEKTKKGLLRNIMIREGFKSKEIMVVLVQNGTQNCIQNKEQGNQKNKYYGLKSLNIEKLVMEFPNIKTVVVNVNTQNTNVVLSRENIVIYGEGYITDKLGEYTFNISPNSFYQVNPVQTEKIYNLAIEKANLKKTDVLCDLYCGIGTIGIFASKYVSKVYGIEIVSEAITDAKENARINNIDNVEFIKGDVETAFDTLLENKVIPNVVIVDPPRKGLDENTVKNLCKLKLEKLVYVSCNPATLMRDLQKLNEIYDITSITPVDNFCYSSHVETVVSMIRK